MTLTFNPRRAMVITHTRAIYQGQTLAVEKLKRKQADEHDRLQYLARYRRR